MKVFLAGGNGKNQIMRRIFNESISGGGVAGNLKAAWKQTAHPTPESFYKGLKDAGFWQGGESRHWIQDVTSPGKENENIPCGRSSVEGGQDRLYDKAILEWRPYILESFYYADADTERLLPYFGDFMLDSGAFTFCGTGKINEKDIDGYLERYAEFINRNKVKKFIELDIDSITGYEKVKQYRAKLEKLTNAQCIPVWHISRGKEEFLRHCDEYPLVALGGYVAAIKTGDPRQKAYVNMYPWFINEAHKRHTKLHGLGFTSIEGLYKYHFDSVDSTAWTTGNRFGYIYKFDGKKMQKINPPKGKRLSDSRQVALNNYLEWIKFQKYADKKL